MQEQKKSAVAEVWAELVDANESPQGDPWTSSYCGHHNPDDEQRCAMERITSELHAPPTSGTGPALRHALCPICTTPYPPDAEHCPACNELLP